MAALGYAPTDKPDRPDLRPIRPGIIFGGASTGFTYRVGNPDDPLTPGRYDLLGVCLGQGIVRVEWTSPAGHWDFVDLACGGEFRQYPVVIDARGQVEFTITPNGEAAGRSGLAVVLTDPRVVAARNALGVPTSTPKSEGEAVLYEPIMNIDESGTRAGSYALLVACAGRGTIEVTFAAGTTTESQTMACVWGNPTGLTLSAPTDGASLTVTIVPDAVAKGEAAVAYRITED